MLHRTQGPRVGKALRPCSCSVRVGHLSVEFDQRLYYSIGPNLESAFIFACIGVTKMKSLKILAALATATMLVACNQNSAPAPAPVEAPAAAPAPAEAAPAPAEPAPAEPAPAPAPAP